MGQLLVVRHGEASLLRTNSDDLSEGGQQQSMALGKCLAACGWHFDAVYNGPDRRHRDTMYWVGEMIRAADRPWPTPVELAGLDEHDDLSLVRASVGALRDDQTIARLRREMLDVRDRQERSRRFQRLYEAVMLRWLRGELEPQGVETWPQFRARVLRCVAAITSWGESNTTMVAFTSVGPMAVLLHRALGLDSEQSFRMAWSVRNSALTSFVFDASGHLSLESFNATPHLSDPIRRAL